MTEELQGSTEPTIETPADNGQVDESGLAPEATPEKVEFSEAQQKVVDGIAAKKTRQLRDAERRSLELQAQLDAAKAKIPQEVRPEVPDPVDMYDDDFESNQAAREEAIRKQAEFDAREAHAKTLADERLNELEANKQKELAASVETYTTRAGELGVSQHELSVAGNVLARAGMADDLAMFIIADESGPLLTKHLAENPDVMEQMRSMTTTQAAVYLATEVKPVVKAADNSSAPPPPDTLDGGSAQTYGGVQGTTYS